MVIFKKLKEIKDDHKRAENDYRNKKSVLIKLCLFEKLCLFFMLKERFERVLKSVLVNHRKKLLRLWIKQRNKSPKCIYNLSKRQSTIREEDALRFGLDNHILPKKLKIDDIKPRLNNWYIPF